MHGSAVSDPGTTEDRVAPGGTAPELPASCRIIAPRRHVLERHRDRGIGDVRGGALGRLGGFHPADWDGCASGRTLSLPVVAASVPRYPAGNPGEYRMGAA